MTKQEVLKRLQSLPDDITPEQLSDELQKLRFRAEIDASIAEIDRGEGIPHEEVERRLAKWLNDDE